MPAHVVLICRILEYLLTPSVLGRLNCTVENSSFHGRLIIARHICHRWRIRRAVDLCLKCISADFTVKSLRKIGGTAAVPQLGLIVAMLSLMRCDACSRVDAARRAYCHVCSSANCCGPSAPSVTCFSDRHPVVVIIFS